MTQVSNIKTFGIVYNEFINLYSKENPLLVKDDIGYCLFTNVVDFHRPLIAKCTIVYDKFLDNLHKIYYVKFDEILESQQIFDEFIKGKNFFTYSTINGINNDLSNKKSTMLGPNFDFTANYFRVDAFFMRDSEEKIRNLRKEYISVIKNDIEKQLSDINSILI